MRVIGTAGHVDHGKSSLIATLTGIHPDRLIEEQQREMTIELGFAWLTLPGGEDIGIIDVPGHRDFIGNMLAGVGGIDAVMLVIAADEGVMPQTKEHLAILDLLQVTKGIVVISKIDLIEDPEWLDLVETDIQNTLSRTTLADAPIIRVSSRDGTGISNLLNSLENTLSKCTDRVDYGRPRLPIDRVFSIPGFGTVVTGTLLDGSFFIGDEIELLPSHKKGKIRGLQIHKNKEEKAFPGTRTAINISGINTNEIQRGDLVVHRGQYKSSRLVDLFVDLLGDISAPIKHGTEVKLFIGTSEIMSKIRLLGKDKLEPGQQGWIQLELKEPVVAMRGDRYILRKPSPGETIGGGIVVDPYPKQRHKRFSVDTIQRLETLLKGSPADILYHACLVAGPSEIKKIINKTGLDQKDALSTSQELINSGMLISLKNESRQELNDGMVIARDQLSRIKEQIESIIDIFHQNQPLKSGVAREELKSRLKLETSIFNSIMSILNNEKVIFEDGSLVRRPDFKINFSPEMDPMKKELLDIISNKPYSPPSVKECIKIVGEDLLLAMIELGDLIKVSPEVIFHSKDYDTLLDKTRTYLMDNGQISVSEARDLFNTSRKYVLGLFEYFDSKGITVRDNDYRRLRK